MFSHRADGLRRVPVKTVAAGLALAAALVGLASPASAASRFLAETGAAAKPTRAWVRFCAEAPSACAVPAGEPAEIAFDRHFLRDLSRVNRDVNREIVPRTDLDHWGVSDRWDFPDDGIGDCEDIQIEKRRRLVALGYPARAMRMAVVINAEGEGHAVLVVRSDEGDYILDNRNDEVVPWYAARYTWVKRESDDGSDRWVALGGRSSPVETAGDDR